MLDSRTALSLLSLLVAAPAAAFVPDRLRFDPVLPTVEDCRDPDFMDGADAGQHSWCVRQLGSALARDLADARGDDLIASIPVPRLGAGGLEPVALDSLRIVQPARLTPINVAHFIYELDGDRVSSCDEYAYQRFHTWTRYRHRVAHLGDPRAVFDVTFADDEPLAIGRLHIDRHPSGSTPLMRRRGSASSPLWDPLPMLPSDLVPDLGVDVVGLPKNDYFSLSNEELDMVGRRDRALEARLDAGRRYWQVRTRGPASANVAHRFPTPWAWHADMSDRLAHVADAELRVRARHRAGFRGLLETRRAMRAEGQSRWSAAVRAVDDEIVTALRGAEDEGCLHFDIFAYDPERGIYDAGRCDWAPDDLLPAMTRQMEPIVEHHRRRCEADAPDAAEVADGYTWRTTWGSLRSTGTDPYRDEYQLQLFLDRKRATIQYYVSQFERQGDDRDGPLVPHFQTAWGDAFAWGDRDWVRAGFGYHTGWGLADRAVRGLDDINPHAEGRMWADAHVFGQRLDVFEARAAFDVRRDERALDLVVAGRDYLDFGWEQAAGARGNLTHFDVVPGAPGDDASVGGEACADLDAAGVPFRLCAGLVGRVGIEVDGAGSGDDTRFEARPFARVDAMGSAGPSVLGIGGGAYVEVNVVDAGLPTRIEATTGAEIGIEAEGALTLTSLAGEVGGYVEFPRICVPFVGCAGGRYSTSFFDWPAAIDETLPLFEHGWVANLDTWVSVCDRPDVHCKNDR